MSRKLRRQKEKKEKKEKKVAQKTATPTVKPVRTLKDTELASTIELAQAVTYQKEKKYKESEALLTKILQEDPNNHEAWYHIGWLKLIQKQHEIAEKFFRSSIALKPNYAKAYSGLGVSRFNLRDYDGAMKAFLKAVEHDPESVQSYEYLTQAYNIKEDYKNAVRTAEKGYALDPDNDTLLLQFSIALYQTKQFQRAIDTLEKRIAKIKNPRDMNRLVLLQKLALACSGDLQYEKADRYYNEILKYQEDDMGVWNNYATNLRGLFRYDEAVAALKKVVESNQWHIQGYHNLGVAACEAGDYKEADFAFLKALDINPASPEVHYNFGSTLLRFEEFERGWHHHEWRWTPGGREKLPLPDRGMKWYGNDLAGKTLLIHIDQGVGDFIMMARYIRIMAEKYPDTELKIEVERKLVGLAEHNFGDLAKVYAYNEVNHDAVDDFDYYISFYGLPYILGTSIDTIPLSEGYMTAPNPKDYRDSPDQLVIGLSWYSQNVMTGVIRNIDIADLAFLGEHKNITFIDLQYGNREKDRAKAKELGLELYYDEDVDSWKDLGAFADQVAACDLIISIDNTTVHVAGAMGIPVWTLLSAVSDWRWFMEHLSTPWYDSVRLIRQTTLNDFAPSLEIVKKDFEKYVAGDKSVVKVENFKRLRHAPAKPKSDKPKAMLLNDTESWYHWGCYGTSTALRNNIIEKGYDLEVCRNQEIQKTKIQMVQSYLRYDDEDFFAHWRERNPTLIHKLETCDTVVINGEGTLHMVSESASKLLYLAYMCKTRLGKNVQIINHSCFPDGKKDPSNEANLRVYKKVYDALDYVSVRDPYSQKILQDIGIDAKLSFDSMCLEIDKRFPDAFPEKRDHAIIVGSSAFSSKNGKAIYDIVRFVKDQGLEPIVLLGAKQDPAPDDKMFIEAMSAFAPDMWRMHDTESFEEWCDYMGTARILISGRYHYTIGAACLGTPFVALEGNTPKMESLSEILDQPMPLKYQDPQVGENVIERAKIKLEEGAMPEKDRKKLIKKLCKMAAVNFGGL